MDMTRRAAIGAAGAALFAPSILRASDRAARSFVVLRGGDDMGSQTNTVTRRGDTLVHECTVRLQVKILGITAFRYELDYIEEWVNGDLVALTSECNDDGTPAFAFVKREGDGLMIEGSGYQGPCPLGVATTSYWSYDFMRRGTWISTQSGEMLTMRAVNSGPAQTPGGAAGEKWTVTGGYDVDVYYVDREWVSIAFDAQGEPVEYIPDSTTQQFAAVWNA